MQTATKRQYTSRKDALGITVRDFAQSDRTQPKNLKTVRAAIESKPHDSDIADVFNFRTVKVAKTKVVEIGKCSICVLTLKNKAVIGKKNLLILVSESESKLLEAKDLFAEHMISWKMVKRDKFLKM